ncbi:hypothetical protein [Enterococcus faecalis]|uniref:hypothetical protein n=1 Tax=Enterococcus TaxID=1350 RepID=UPI002FBEC45B
MMGKKRIKLIDINSQEIQDLEEIKQLWEEQKPFVGKLTLGIVTEILIKEELKRLKNKN